MATLREPLSLTVLCAFLVWWLTQGSLPKSEWAWSNSPSEKLYARFVSFLFRTPLVPVPAETSRNP